jgi:isoleucyl-tRNA synthetase
MAVAAHPDFTYAKVRYLRESGEKDTVIVMKDLDIMAGWDEYQVLEEMNGEDLSGLEYVSPFAEDVPYQSKVKGEWVHKIILSDTVEAENTGLVHIAPGHGPEDFELGQRYDISPFCPVDEAGHYTEEGGTRYSGMFVKKANKVILEDLEDREMLFYRSTIEHRYGHCWRCESNIIYRTTRQWFLQVTKLKELMLNEVDRVRWTPDWAGSSRQRGWVENARDWCISRQRFWGIPIPVWTCECGAMEVVASMDELKGAEGYSEDLEPHRPWIDEVHPKCPKCGGSMNRVPDVLNVWFDAGVCSWAQLGFPRNTDRFERWWPSRWIVEAHDQTRGWFYSQLAAGCIAFDRAPYESVLMHGWILDPKGERMSKSKGNAIEPGKIMDEFGADALRFYLLRSNAPWEDLSFQHEGVKNARKMLNILWNVFKFAATYMSIDNFTPDSVDHKSLGGALRSEDHWMISKTERIKNEMTKYLNSYELHRASRALEDYIVEDLSRWYVRLIRDRMWKEEGDSDKLAAYKVLYDSLMTASKLLAPICPHITEEIYRHMDGERESVHMLDWPTPDLTKVSERLESSMKVAQELVEIIASERQQIGLKLRWLLKRVVIRCKGEEMMQSLETLGEVIASQGNVKEVEFLAPGQDWDEMILSVIPNPHAIGKVYRQWSSKIAVLLKSRSAKHIKESISKGEYQLGIEGQMIKIEPNMVSFSSSLPPDVVDVQFSEGEMYIDFMVTPEIEAEGFARELVRRIQQMRKDMKMDVEEFISTEVKASATMTEYFRTWKDHIMKETRSRKLVFTEKPEGEYSVDWKVEGDDIHISVTSLNLKDSLEDLMEIPGLGQEKALALIDGGVHNLEELKKKDTEFLEGLKGITEEDIKSISEFLRPSDKEGPEDEGSPMEEMVEYLLSIPNVDEEIAVAIYQAGFDTVEKIRSAPEEEMRKVAGDLAPEIIDYTPKVKLKKQLEEKEVVSPPPGGDGGDLDMEKGFTYLIKEERSKHSYELFERSLGEGMKGFCVTRNYPLKIRSKYTLGDTPMIWLSSIGKENTLRPKDLEKLSFALDQFINTEGGIILLDGLEYLITNNNFLTVLRFVQSLRDQVAINESILLLALNPSTLEESELNLLEKEVDTTV